MHEIDRERTALRILRGDVGALGLIALGPDARPAALYRHGAILVSNGPVALGCLSWSEV